MPPAAPLVPIVDRLHARERTLRRATLTHPFLSVVIVNYCQWRNTARLTRQLRHSSSARSAESEIVIVDNCSPRHPLLNKLRRVEGVSLRRFARNRGFARAVNEGVRLSEGEWVLLLNPDSSVGEGFLDRATEMARTILREDAKVGVAGLRVLNSDGSLQPSCGPLPTFVRTLGGLLLPRSRRKCQPLTTVDRTAVPWATGCALLIRRDCLKETGGFDEDFFLYYEDVDFCRRAKSLGWKVCFEPGLEVTHHTPLHGRAVPPALRMMTRHALLTYGIKHWPRWQTTLLGGLIWMESGLRQLVARCMRREQETHVHGQIRQIVGDVLAGRERTARARIREAAMKLVESSTAQDGKTC